MWPIAIVADIEKAFLMIQVADVDQDVLRFLWYKDVFCENLELQIYKFTRVVFGVAPSPYLLNATIAQHLSTFESRYPDLIQKIKDSIYVDNVITGVDN
uniref:Reverse transcriptase domain-containing protein n=1 Tax=Amphimedon queenslandica TaxID=400682 RepID=A0A1X7SD88_AMPQE